MTRKLEKITKIFTFHKWSIFFTLLIFHNEEKKQFIFYLQHFMHAKNIETYLCIITIFSNKY